MHLPLEVLGNALVSAVGEVISAPVLGEDPVIAALQVVGLMQELSNVDSRFEEKRLVQILSPRRAPKCGLWRQRS